MTIVASKYVLQVAQRIIDGLVQLEASVVRNVHSCRPQVLIVLLLYIIV